MTTTEDIRLDITEVSHYLFCYLSRGAGEMQSDTDDVDNVINRSLPRIDYYLLSSFCL